MERALVAGGVGFIGSNLCRELCGEHQIICLDDYSSGRSSNVQDLKAKKNFRILEHDIIKPFGAIEKNIGDIDAIFHLASRASPEDYQKYPLQTLLSNTQGTMNLLELCRKKDASFLFASTSEVYGEPLEHPQKETYRGNVSTTGIRACYDEGKRTGETLISIYIRLYGIDARIVRIFNTYGPGMKYNDGRVVSNFITQALTGRDITIFGSGSQTRSFCYVSDMVEGISKAMRSKKAKGEIINLGNPEEFTVKELAERVIRMTDSKARLAYKALPEDDPSRRNPDISKARRMLSWSPVVNLEKGLSKTIDYFSAELKIVQEDMMK